MQDRPDGAVVYMEGLFTKLVIMEGCIIGMVPNG